MKTPTTQQNEDTSKTTAQTKSTKKSTKSRAKSTKVETPSSGNTNKNVAGNFTTTNSGPLMTQQQQGNTTNQLSLIAAPTTPTSSLGGSGGVGSHHKSYAALEPRSIKIIWEQHDQSDVELSAEVCARVAEDASYKLWELINNIKTYSRHSGGMITYDLVNEVLRDSDVPPCLGAMDSDWDRIDYDGSYFFYSDKILELRDEYQKDVSFNVPHGPDFKCSWPAEDKHMENLKKYVPSLIYVALHGNLDDLDTVLCESAFSPLIGSCYRLILTKIIQIIAFKQSNDISSRCWSLLRALASNPQTRDVDCREEYFHLAEILVCQLLAPYESIKVRNNITKAEDSTDSQTVKLEVDNAGGFVDNTAASSGAIDHGIDVSATVTENSDKNYKLQIDNDEEVTSLCDGSSSTCKTSPYFATPVDRELVDELCETLGMLGALNGYFQSECLFHILRRLQRFFDGRLIHKERDYNYISRSICGLVALGEYAFREFIPFLYKLKVDDIPESLWNDFAISAVFLQGGDDIFLYEWLEYVCGGDKLQPFLTYHFQYYEKFLTYRYLKRKQSTFKLNPKLGVRRLEWNALAAAMCHGDDPNKALKPKPSLNEIFPELKPINMKLNRAGNIRFKFAGCRPVILKPKNKYGLQVGDNNILQSSLNGSSDVLIAKRRLFKPLTNGKRMIPLSSYNYLNI